MLLAFKSFFLSLSLAVGSAFLSSSSVTHFEIKIGRLVVNTRVQLSNGSWDKILGDSV